MANQRQNPEQDQANQAQRQPNQPAEGGQRQQDQGSQRGQAQRGSERPQPSGTGRDDQRVTKPAPGNSRDDRRPPEQDEDR